MVKYYMLHTAPKADGHLCEKQIRIAADSPERAKELFDKAARENGLDVFYARCYLEGGGYYGRADSKETLRLRIYGVRA